MAVLRKRKAANEVLVLFLPSTLRSTGCENGFTSVGLLHKENLQKMLTERCIAASLKKRYCAFALVNFLYL